MFLDPLDCRNDKGEGKGGGGDGRTSRAGVVTCPRGGGSILGSTGILGGGGIVTVWESKDDTVRAYH